MAKQQPVSETGFSDWLYEEMGKIGVSISGLHRALARQNYDVTEMTVRRWVMGTKTPVDALPAVLEALQESAPNVDVWGDFVKWVGPFAEAPRRKRSTGKASNQSFSPAPRATGGHVDSSTAEPVARLTERHLHAVKA